MNDQVLFLNMFSEIQPPEELKEVLSQAVVSAADIDPEEGSVSVHIFTEQYIPTRLIDEIRDQVIALSKDPEGNAEKIAALKVKMSKKQRIRNLMDKVKLVLKIGN